jgi:hypothetical protein
MLGQNGQTTVFLLDAGYVAFSAGQAYGKLIAEPEGPVVPALAGHGLDREVAPLGELFGDQGVYEISGYVDHRSSLHAPARRGRSPVLSETNLGALCNRGLMRKGSLCSPRRKDHVGA